MTRRTPRRRRAQAVIYDEQKVTAAEAALMAARVSGCTCDPEIDLEGIAATVYHDDWCALLRREDRN